ncbi:hypothetical protein BD410DRAFT_619867 [Rickenella mellea]|uniref:F-box domain-containing protein n=1 Tax=Rickenella mellea TaxID=50990 RepID=A0A4Y7PQ12_9AGAM|nr:hypothetical protein BD410DRAFT_619867 [Rickenella mellea]
MIIQLPEDVQTTLLACADLGSLKALSLTSKFWRQLCSPVIFRKTIVRGTWATADAAVETLLQSREICILVWRFTFIINVKGDNRRGLSRLFRTNRGDRMIPRRTFPPNLAKLLARMTSLKLLKFSIPVDTVPLFEAAFSTASVPLRFECVRGLSTDTSCHLLVQYCPKLNAVAVDLAARWRHQTIPSETLVLSLVGRSIQFLSLWDCWSSSLTSGNY